MKPRTRRPPRKICAVCGTEFYAYGRDACARCWAERADDRSALVRVIKDRRPAKPAPTSTVLNYGELPEGF